MTNTKRCELCRNPFEPLKDEDHCKGCSRISGLQRFFDTDVESLKNSMEKYLNENNGYRLLTESGQDFLRQAN